MSDYGCFFSDIFAVFSCSSKWRKTSKCKYYINLLLRSVEIHRRRLESMIRQSRSDFSQLRRSGSFSEATDHLAIAKVKHICEDEKRLMAYDEVEYYCKIILKNMSFLKCESDLYDIPEDVQEAMAGLIFGASRIGELQVLEDIRGLFIERFGLEFERICVTLGHDNMVHSVSVLSLDKKVEQDEIREKMDELEKSLKEKTEKPDEITNIVETKKKLEKGRHYEKSLKKARDQTTR